MKSAFQYVYDRQKAEENADAAIDCYVIVVCKSNRKAFILNRAYGVEEPLFHVSEEDEQNIKLASVENWDGWMPDGQSRPDWAQELTVLDFVAYWMY